MSDPVQCRRYAHGGARFFTVDKDGREHLYADTYCKTATEVVAAAPEMYELLQTLSWDVCKEAQVAIGQLLARIDGEEATA